MTDLTKIKNLQELYELTQRTRMRGLGQVGPDDPLQLTKEKYDYIMRTAPQLSDQIDHENLRWKGDK